MKTPQQKNRLGSFLWLITLIIYQLGWYLLTPLVLLRLYWRSRKEPGYIQHIAERFGFYSQKPKVRAIWIHAVSVGETRAAQPLIDQLVAQGQTVLLTHMTPTGRRTGNEIFKSYIAQGQLIQAYLPYDFLGPVARFFKSFDLKMGAMMETEAWPTIVFIANFIKFPLYQVNARLSERSARRVARFGGLGKILFQSFYQILAQTPADQNRYQSLGAQNVIVTGNLKFDVPLNQLLIERGLEWHKHAFHERSVVCLASSREGEEELFLNAWMNVLKQMTPKPLLIIVPRHPARFDDVASMIQSRGLSITRRSEINFQKDISEDVVLGDSMGEMPLYLSASDLVVMGGALLPFGGQNLIEPCSLGKPVILGQHTFNFLQASEDAIQAGAAWRLESEEKPALELELTQKLLEILSQELSVKNASEAAKLFAKKYTGATKKTIEVFSKHF
jgi:3-deoxy-D-manno-octulosonic-acid transferase